MKCNHQYRIFKDPDLIKTGYLSFYCQYCLKLRKIKKIYEDEENAKKAN